VDGKIPWEELMNLFAQRMGRAADRRHVQHLLAQMVEITASLIDDIILEKNYSQAPQEDRYVRRHFERHDRHAQELAVLGSIEDGGDGKPQAAGGGQPRQDRIIQKYVWGARRASEHTTHLRCAVDAARVGTLDALAGIFMVGDAPDLRCFWIPPQVHFAHS
jgi:hypothetical protein